MTLGADIKWGRSCVYDPYDLWPYTLWRTDRRHIDIESGFLLRILRENRVRRGKGKIRMFCFVFLMLVCSILSKTRFSCASYVSRNMFRQSPDFLFLFLPPVYAFMHSFIQHTFLQHWITFRPVTGTTITEWMMGVVPSFMAALGWWAMEISCQQVKWQYYLGALRGTILSGGKWTTLGIVFRKLEMKGKQEIDKQSRTLGTNGVR